MMGVTHIAAVGARTPVGLTAESSAAAVRADICQLSMHPFMIDRCGEPVRGALDALLDPTLMGWPRLVELAKSPLLEVGEKLTVMGSEWKKPVEVLLALPEYRPGWTRDDADQVVQALGNFTVPNLGPLRVKVLAHGHASALVAVNSAAKRIAAGDLELCLVGGVDSYFEADTIDWLQEHKQLAIADVRSGFFPGEGAGVVAVASLGTLRALRLASLAKVHGGHHATEAKLIKTDAVNLGEAMTAAVAGAIKGLRLPDEAVDTIYGDINGERYRSEEWGFVALALPHACRDASVYELPSATWGDMGAASGALFAVLAVAAWERDYAHGPRALLWAGSESGLRAALVLQEAKKRN